MTKRSVVMQIRGSLISVLVVAILVVIALLATLVLTRSQTTTPAANSSNRPAALDNLTSPMTNDAVSTDQKSISATQAVAAELPAPPRPAGLPAPELIGGGSWINSEPLTLAKLKGQVVLVNFWSYGCYNCQNTLPYVKQWWNKYKDQGLVIIGVHTPEFDSEAQLQNVQDAVRREGIGWPVVQDNDKRIW